jgi:transcriptional activator
MEVRLFGELFDAERTRLDELTLVATESRAGADLGLGRHGELAGELEALCREHPLRERLWELLILALYRSGRQAAPPEAAGDSLAPRSLLETKLYVPRSRRGLVPRPRLSERLDRGTASKLTLVSAPAGFAAAAARGQPGQVATAESPTRTMEVQDD